MKFNVCTTYVYVRLVGWMFLFFHPAIFNPIYGGKKAAKRNEYNINNGKVIAHSVGATFPEIWLKIFVVVHFTAGALVVLFT